MTAFTFRALAYVWKRLDMRQLIYISTASGSSAGQDVAQAILAVSRRNNAAAGITGLLYADGKRFLQALEGDDALVERALTRIAADTRHRAIVILSDRRVADREFGDWSMAYRPPGADRDAFVGQVGALVAQASASVQATFNGFADLRRAA